MSAILPPPISLPVPPTDPYTSDQAQLAIMYDQWLNGHKLQSDEEVVSPSNPLPVTNPFQTPVAFTEQTSSSKTILIQKGQINNYRLRPQIRNEHVETARESQSVVTSTNEVGQIFKASQDNINGIALTMESAQGEIFDDFESYADSAALQVNWVPTDAGYPAELETGIVAPNFSSTKSMMLPGDATVLDEWYRAFTSTDFSGYTGEFDLYATHDYSTLKLRVYVQDSVGNTSSLGLVHQEDSVWEHFEIDINSLTADLVTPADLTDITRIGFRLEDRRNNSAFYIDNMVSIPGQGQVSVELWDMGSTIPVDGVTSLDDGTQYTELGDRGVNSGTVAASVTVDLLGGKRQYQLNRFVAGVALEIPGNTLLTVDNYYAIVIKYIDTNVTVYGANTSFETNYYENGYAFTTPDNSTPISKIGEYNDIQFIVFSTQDVYINTLLKFYDAEPGNNATEYVYVENKDMGIQGIIANESVPQQTLLAEFRDRTYYFPKGGKFEVNHNDDFSDSTTQITILLGYIYEPPTING